MSELAATQTGEVGFSAVGAGAVDAVTVLVVDPLHGKAGVQRIPGRALIGMECGALGNPQTDSRHGVSLGREHLRQRAPAALAHGYDDLARARLVLGKPPVGPVGSQVLRPDVAAEISAVDLGCASIPADPQRPRGGRHGLAQFVRQHEGRLVLHVEVAAERQHALAFDFVTEHRNGHQVGPERQLVPGEQGARGRRELRPARLAAPARLVFRATTVVAGLAAAVGANRFAIRLGPAQAHEHVLRASLGHPSDLARAERAGSRGQEEVLRHQGRLKS